MNPTQATNVARLVEHQSDASSYTLGLHLARTALHFNGTSDSALIEGDTQRSTSPGAITLEAWIKAEKTDGLRDVFGHGYVLDSRRRGRAARAGRQRTTSAPTTAPTTASASRCRRATSTRGCTSPASTTAPPGSCTATACSPAAPPTPSVPCTSPATGRSAAPRGTNDRFFAGAIDEVRLWRVARSADADRRRHEPFASPATRPVWPGCGGRRTP